MTSNAKNALGDRTAKSTATTGIKSHSARRKPSKPRAVPQVPAAPQAAAAAPSKLSRITNLLARPGGATLAELSDATGWQKHSVRGALAGALKRKGHIVTSEKVDGVRRYRLGSGPRDNAS